MEICDYWRHCRHTNKPDICNKVECSRRNDLVDWFDAIEETEE